MVTEMINTTCWGEQRKDIEEKRTFPELTYGSDLQRGVSKTIFVGTHVRSIILYIEGTGGLL